MTEQNGNKDDHLLCRSSDGSLGTRVAPSSTPVPSLLREEMNGDTEHMGCFERDVILSARVLETTVSTCSETSSEHTGDLPGQLMTRVGDANGARFGTATSTGGRAHQDDRCVSFCFRMIDGTRVSVGAVMDGHHGSDVSDLVATRLATVLVDSVSRADSVEQGLARTVDILDTETYEAYRSGKVPTGGTTLLIVLLTDEYIYTANVGDCKAVLSSRGAPEALTEAHNPPIQSEKQRFEAAGVPCFADHIGGSDINVCRTLGDYDLGEPLKWRCFGDTGNESQACGPLSSQPEISKHRIEEIDEFLVAATDGVWDYYTPESSVITQARQQLRIFQSTPDGPSTCASWLVETALSRQREVLHSGTAGDNVTVLFIQLRPLAEIPRTRTSRLNLRSRTGSSDASHSIQFQS